jgi:hypothetical protein
MPNTILHVIRYEEPWVGRVNFILDSASNR